MNKNKKHVVCIIMALCLSFCAAVPSFASDDDVISEQQAYDLMAEARLLCAYVNQLDTIDTAPSGFLPDGFSIDDYYYKGEYLYTADTVNAILKLPQKVYSKDISDKAWKTSIENNSLKSILLITEEDLDKDKDYMKKYRWGGYLIFPPVNSLGTIKDVRELPLGCYAAFSDRLIKFDYNGNGVAKAEVIGSIYDVNHYASIPISFSVEFKKETDGWRISGGEFVNAMCDINNFKYSTLCNFKHYHEATTDTVGELLGKMGFFYDGQVLYTLSYSTFVSDNHVKYVMHVKGTDPSGKPLDNDYTAYFKSVSESDFKKNYAGKEDLVADTSPDGRYLVFYGGGLYDLLVNGNPDAEQYHGESAPYTGDESVKEIIILTSVAITAACACLCLIRKRKKIEA